jgi:hypothetical protein
MRCQVPVRASPAVVVLSEQIPLQRAALSGKAGQGNSDKSSSATVKVAQVT